MAQLQEWVLDDNDAMGWGEGRRGEAVDKAEEGSKRFATVQTQLRRFYD